MAGVMATSTADSNESFARRGPARRLLIALIGIALAAPIAVADGHDCGGIDREVVFAGLDWGSAQLHNHIAGQILQAGFGCEYTDIPGSTVPMVQGLVRGDIDINMEIWFNTAPDIYREATEAGDVIDLGLNMNAGEMSFLVPRYVIEGDAERGIEPMAPDLKSVDDLPKYKELFRDPEEPDKGRYYNCIVGWQCELTNNKKLAAYDLEEHFTNFRPGAAPALDASIVGAYEKGEAWLGYYWAPTTILGLYPMIQLEEPAWSQECWDGDRGCAFRPSIVNVAISKDFEDSASDEMIDFLRAYEVELDLINFYLAHQSETDSEWPDVAREFLATHADVWTEWVSDAVADRVRASLN